MNKQFINSELKKRGISVTFFWQGNAGPALRFYTGKSGNEAYWNALLPIDDESDAAFVDFVEMNYKRLLTPRALDGAYDARNVVLRLKKMVNAIRWKA